MTEEKTTTEVKQEIEEAQPTVEKIEAPKKNSLGNIKFDKGKITIDGKPASAEQLRQMGIVTKDPYTEVLESLSEEDRAIAMKYIGMSRKPLSRGDLVHRINKFKKNRKKNRVAKASRKQNRQFAKKNKLG